MLLGRVAIEDKVANAEKVVIEVIEDKELAGTAGGVSSRLRRRAAQKSRLAIESFTF